MSILHKLLLTNKDFYFRSWDDDALFNFVLGKGYFIKRPERPPAGVHPAKSNLLTDRLLQFEEISKAEFEDF